MNNNYLTIPISIIAIFFISFLVIIIRNIYFNAKNYSRKLRLFIFFIGLAYIVNIAIFIPALIIDGAYDITLIIILGVLSHLTMSICGIWVMLHFDEKKASVRDAWKYRAKFYSNFKLSSVPSRKFEFFLDITKATFLFIYFGLSTSLAIIAGIKHANIFMSMGIFGLIDLIINYLIMGKTTTYLIKENVRYNELKSILLYENLGDKPKKEVATKAAKLYDELFTNSGFYNKAIDTNNAIIIEIANKGHLEFEDVQKFLKDPIAKNSNPPKYRIIERYEVPEWW